MQLHLTVVFKKLYSLNVEMTKNMPQKIWRSKNFSLYRITSRTIYDPVPVVPKGCLRHVADDSVSERWHTQQRNSHLQLLYPWERGVGVEQCHFSETKAKVKDIEISREISFYQFSRSVMSDSLWPHEPKHARPPCPSPIPRVHTNPCPLSQWYHPTISSSVIPYSSHLHSFPASGSFPISQLFASGGQRIGVSASTSVLPVNTQDWSPLGWTGWISFQSKGLSRVFSNTTVQKHQYFCAQLSL